MDKDKALTIIDAWKKFSIKDCVKHAALALSDLRSSTLNGCWSAIWPECLKRKNPVDPNTKEYPYIIDLGLAVVLKKSLLYPPHRGYISFVNTFVTHRNNDLGPYVP